MLYMVVAEAENLSAGENVHDNVIYDLCQLW